MDARFNKCASKPKPPAQKRTVLPALTKTQQRPVRCDGGLVSVAGELVRSCPTCPYYLDHCKWYSQPYGMGMVHTHRYGIC